MWLNECFDVRSRDWARKFEAKARNRWLLGWVNSWTWICWTGQKDFSEVFCWLLSRCWISVELWHHPSVLLAWNPCLVSTTNEMINCNKGQWSHCVPMCWCKGGSSRCNCCRMKTIKSVLKWPSLSLLQWALGLPLDPLNVLTAFQLTSISNLSQLQAQIFEHLTQQFPNSSVYNEYLSEHLLSDPLGSEMDLDFARKLFEKEEVLNSLEMSQFTSWRTTLTKKKWF